MEKKELDTKIFDEMIKRNFENIIPAIETLYFRSLKSNKDDKAKKKFLSQSLPAEKLGGSNF